jgi:hypothetical protein
MSDFKLRQRENLTVNKSLVILNGPPGSGKDAFFSAVKDEFNCFNLKFAEPLKRGVHELLGLDTVEAAAFENCKDIKHSQFFYRSPREVYIEASEHFMKKLFGNFVFGHIWCRRAATLLEKIPTIETVIITDCGFVDELIPVKFYWKGPVHLVKIYRPGHSFANDSRGYVKVGDVVEHRIDNNGTLAEYHEKAKQVMWRVARFYEGTANK